jgi:hypothetical protein
MRRWVGLLALAVAAWAWATLACSGESSFLLPPVDAGAIDTRYADACAAWAQAVCNRESTCPGSDPIHWTDPTQCRTQSALICEVVATDPNVSFDAETLGACQYSMDCSTPARDLPIDCLSPGRSPPGAPCVFEEACTSGYCDTTTGVCGICASPSVPCGCPSGQVCAGKALDGGAICDDASAVGGSCMLQVECTNSYCSLGSDGHGRCVPFVGLDERCGDGEGAAIGREGTPCAGPDTYCDATLKCSPIEFQGYMLPCGTPGDGGPWLICAGYGTCDPSSNTCIPPAPNGQVCDETQGLGCALPADCIANRCLYPSLAYCGL